MGRVKAALALGWPLTVREVARWADCDPSTARGLLNELSGRGEAVRVELSNEQYNLWSAVTAPAIANPQGLMLIAKRFHQATSCPTADVFYGANFVECPECGKHAHVGSDLMKPLIAHRGASASISYSLRPQDF